MILKLAYNLHIKILIVAACTEITFKIKIKDK